MSNRPWLLRHGILISEHLDKTRKNGSHRMLWTPAFRLAINRTLPEIHYSWHYQEILPSNSPPKDAKPLHMRCIPRGIHPVGLLTTQPTDKALTKTWLEGNKASYYNPKGQMFETQVEFLFQIPVWESIPDCSICTFL